MKMKRMVELPELMTPEAEVELTDAQIAQAVQRALTNRE